MNYSFALVSPLANESDSFALFTSTLKKTLERIGAKNYKVFFVVDNVSKDDTLDLCKELSAENEHFITIWAPENRNVVDAYLRGYKEALKEDFDFIIEMDGGMSHDPAALPGFLRALTEGHYCVYGSRFINGGSIYNSNFKRWFLSRFGTFLSNMMLGTSMHDMTSGYMGFHSQVARLFVENGLKSKAHFYQTEVRYLLRYERYIEIPIHYIAPSPRVSQKAVSNSIDTLIYYFKKRICGKPVSLKQQTT